jgi:hypothetical protein
VAIHRLVLVIGTNESRVDLAVIADKPKF